MFRESQVKKVEESDLGYAREIDSTEGKYFLIFGWHDMQQPIPKNLKDFSACTLETGVLNWSSTQDKSGIMEEIKHHPQYAVLVDELNKNGIPIIFADPETSQSLSYLIRIDDNLITNSLKFLLSAGVGGYTAEKAQEMLKEKKASRRDMLKLMMGAAVVAKASEGPAANLVGKLHHDQTIGHEPSSAMAKVNEFINPEIWLILITFRNAIIAYKERYLMRQKNSAQAEKPNKVFSMGIVIGEGHAGIETMINLSDGLLLKIIQTLKPLAEHFCNKESSWKIVECKPVEFEKREEINGMQTHSVDYKYEFNVTEVPELRQIFSQ